MLFQMEYNDMTGYSSLQTTTQLVGDRVRFALVFLATADDAAALNRLAKSIERWCVGYGKIVIYHNGDVSRSALTNILRDEAVTQLVDLQANSNAWNRLPEGFDPATKAKRSSKWGHNHKIRFWFADVFQQPELQEFDYLVRLDSDSCLFGPLVLPEAIQPHHVYKPNQVWNGDHGATVKELWETVTGYIAKEKIVPRNAHMWWLSSFSHRRLGQEIGFQVTLTQART